MQNTTRNNSTRRKAPKQNAELTPDHIDVAGGELSDAALDAIASLLIASVEEGDGGDA